MKLKLGQENPAFDVDPSVQKSQFMMQQSNSWILTVVAWPLVLAADPSVRHSFERIPDPNSTNSQIT